MLDVKRTIETAFERASGWLAGKYPSAKKEQTLQIDVLYPEETPSAEETVNDSGAALNNKIHYIPTPYRLSIRRWGTDSADILFSKDMFIDPEDKKEKAAYRLSVRDGDKRFNAIETPDGAVLTQGDISILIDLQKDPDFGTYVTFIPKGEMISKNTKFLKGNLDKAMEKARPSIGD